MPKDLVIHSILNADHSNPLIHPPLFSGYGYATYDETQSKLKFTVKQIKIF